jgi:hypothetical protein
VVGNGVLADEQPVADVSVRQTVAGESRDLGLLGRELILGLDAALSHLLAGCQQLALRTRREGTGAEPREHVERGAQRIPSIHAAAPSAEPLAVEKVSAGEPHADARATEPFDRLEVQAFRLVAVGEQGVAQSLGPSAQSVPAARVVCAIRSNA